jgi:hypothetical protein
VTWVKIDDAALSNPKLLAAGPEAVCLWLGGLAYCNRHHTNGSIPTDALHALYPSDKWKKGAQARAAKRLVEVGLWRESADGFWQIPNYAKFQQPALSSTVEAKRETEAERQRIKRSLPKDSQPIVDAFSIDSQPIVDAFSDDCDQKNVSFEPVFENVESPRPGPSRPDHIYNTGADAPSVQQSLMLPEAANAAPADQASKKREPKTAKIKTSAQIARRITLAIYAAEKIPLSLPANFSGWREIGDFGESCVAIGLSMGRRYAIDDVLGVMIEEVVKVHGRSKPVTYWSKFLNAAWEGQKDQIHWEPAAVEVAS